MDTAHFREMITQEFNLDAYPPEEQAGYIDQIGELVLQGVLIKAVSAMDEPTAQALEAIIDRDGTPDEIVGYLQSAVPGLADLVRDEVMSVKADLATETGE